jgi:hypothetical protein
LDLFGHGKKVAKEENAEGCRANLSDPGYNKMESAEKLGYALRKLEL